MVVASLTFIFGIVFLLFSYGHQGYDLLDTRQGVQVGTLAAKSSLAQDFSYSHFDSVAVVEGSLDEKRRDVVCALALSNWNDAANFTPVGAPQWDRFVVYHVSSQESGALIRTELDAKPLLGDLTFGVHPLPPGPMGLMGQSSLPAEFEPHLLNRRLIVGDVKEFACKVDETRQLLQIRLKLFAQSGVSPTGAKRVKEGAEAVFEFDPVNTFPKL